MRAIQVATVCLLVVPGTRALGSFTQQEIKAIQNRWSNHCQMESHPAGNPGSEWCVRLTPTGSKWIREVYRQFQSGKVIPTQDPKGQNERTQAWIAWIDRQVERDWQEAQKKCDELNSGQFSNVSQEKVAIKSDKFTLRSGLDKVGRNPLPSPPAQEDPCPKDLEALVGAPPRFSAPVRPMHFEIRFEDGTTISYNDNVRVRPKYAYYRFANGVNSEGMRISQISDSDFSNLIRSAGLTRLEEKAMRATSLLEGGFDSVNTYDTGYVSVGFIQFASMAEGAGSLGSMMQHYKSSNLAGFDRDFRAYGIDVEQGKLIALDLVNGVQKIGPEASLEIIDEKRLIAVFQRAGLKSKEFRVAQLQSARDQFYPGKESILVNFQGQSQSVPLNKIFRSEAGMATLMDRKVNTGKLAGLKECLDRIVEQNEIKSIDELADFEYQIVRSMTYREDFLASNSLSKPRDMSTELARKGKRSGRGHLE